MPKHDMALNDLRLKNPHIIQWCAVMADASPQ